MDRTVRQNYLSSAIDGFRVIDDKRLRSRVYPIGVLTGEGIGAEVIGVCLRVLEVLESRLPVSFDIRVGGRIGRDAQQTSGSALTAEVIEFCQSLFDEGGAVLCGPGGARFVYDLRREFDLYCKLVPIQPLEALAGSGVIRAKASKDVDILIVRENIDGLYFGESQTHGSAGLRRVDMTFSYHEAEIRRIITVAARAARRRRGQLCVVNKPGATGDMAMIWQSVAEEVSQAENVALQMLEVDNACYQLVANASEFDVVVTLNMFGDLLSDGAALLLASRGMSYSANYGIQGKSVYQTGHGAAYDLAGKDVANPLGQLLSTGMMLRESFGLFEASELLFEAINSVLSDGFRTADLMVPGCRQTGTREFGEKVCLALEELLHN